MSDEKRVLSVDEMLSADDVEYALVPTWKVRDIKTGELVQGYTRVGSLSADEIISWRETNEGPAKRSMGVRLFVNSLVDEDGNRIGTEKHYEAFKKKSNAVQERVLAEIVKLNGMTVKAEEKIKND